METVASSAEVHVVSLAVLAHLSVTTQCGIRWWDAVHTVGLKLGIVAVQGTTHILIAGMVVLLKTHYEISMTCVNIGYERRRKRNKILEGKHKYTVMIRFRSLFQEK